MRKTAFVICAIFLLVVPIKKALAVKWEIRADISQHVYGHGGAVVNDKLYNIGGCETADWTVTSKNIQVYNYKTNVWSKLDDMPIELGWPMVAVYGRKVYVFGGMRSGAVSTNKALKYDPANYT
jgi:N-acetylneuraminic acid mutarotase